MIDMLTKKPFQVVESKMGGPYFQLAADQVEPLRKFLESRGVFHWFQESQLSFDGGPYKTYVYFGRNAKAQDIQAILDSVN